MKKKNENSGNNDKINENEKELSVEEFQKNLINDLQNEMENQKKIMKLK